jgi:D-glycero-D-manno-heptose 1,7-bisphosphate phosphatase
MTCLTANTMQRGNTLLIWMKAPHRHSRPFLLLDRDGVINEDRPDYIKSRREFKFYPDALQALRWLREQHIPVVIVSNQSGLNRGLISWEDFWDIHTWMIRRILDSGGDIMGACYCPHHPQEGCSCRKPSPGMIKAASEIFHFSLQKTFLIGDRDSDLLAANRAGCRSMILDRSGQSIQHPPPVPGANPAIKSCSSLMDAVLVLSERGEL